MASVCLSEKSKGKPDAGNLHVRFDEGEGYSLPTLLADFFCCGWQKASRIMGLEGFHQCRQGLVDRNRDADFACL